MTLWLFCAILSSAAAYWIPTDFHSRILIARNNVKKLGSKSVFLEVFRAVAKKAPIAPPETEEVVLEWFQSGSPELKTGSLPVAGQLPSWLEGSLVHTAPALFEYGPDVVDWGGGASMLFKLEFDSEQGCTYQCRFLDSYEHRMNKKANRVVTYTGGTRPTEESFWERFRLVFSSKTYENANAHISRMAHSRLVVTNPATQDMEFNLGDLATVGAMHYDDSISGVQEISAEARIDPETGEWIVAAIRFNPFPEYVVYAVDSDAPIEAGSKVARREIGAFANPDGVGFLHSFAITEHLAVIIHAPLLLTVDGVVKSELQYLFTGKTQVNLDSLYTWDPSKRNIVYLMNRSSGAVQTVELSRTWYYSHVVNAYEEVRESDGGTEVVIDVCSNPEPPSELLKSDDTRSIKDWRLVAGELRRVRIDLSTGKSVEAVMPGLQVDSLYIHPQYVGRKNRYSYGEAVALCEGVQTLRLVKVDHELNTTKYWRGQDVKREVPMSPMFAPYPRGCEDDGVLISYVRDHPTGDSFVLLLDAGTFRQVATMPLPSGHHVPHLVHSHWVPQVPPEVPEYCYLNDDDDDDDDDDNEGKLFDTLDRTGDGYLYPGDLQAFLGPDVDEKEFFKMYDLNKDGRISRDEFLRSMEIDKLQAQAGRSGPASTLRSVPAIFSMLDSNNDGYITREDLEGKVSKELIESFFQKYDLNGDGITSFDEFRERRTEEELCERLFYKLARRGDGYVYPGDLQAYVEKEEMDEQAFFEMYDLDKDGRVSYDEFMTCGIGKAANTEASSLIDLTRFTMLDLDGDGYITREDLAKSEVSEELINEFFSLYGQNSAGRVSFNEMRLTWGSGRWLR